MKFFRLSSRMRVELLRARRPLVIVALGVVAAIAAGAEIVGHENVHLPWQGSYTAHIAVDNATGVVGGLDEVRWAGIVVGRVTGVQFEHGQPVLSAEMNTGDLDGARLYRNATVQLRPETPLSDMYLDVVNRGTKSAGVLGPNQVLTASQTQAPVNVADVMDTFSEPVRTRLQELLDELATGLSPAGGTQLRDAFGYVGSLLVAQKRLSNVIAQRKVIVTGLVHDSRLLFDELSARNTQLATLLRTGSGTFAALGAQSPALRSLIAELPGTLSTMQSSFGQLQTTLADVRPALTDLVPTANALPAGLNALKRFSAPATPALTALEPAVDALEPLATNLAPTATALHQAFTTLVPQAPRLDRVTAKVVPCELPVDKFFAWTLSVLKFGNATNLSSSPRGLLVAGPFEDPSLKDPTVAPVIGCADGKPAPTTTDQ
ncbi:MAG TPA: MlaD family protein [Solirubrobacteraceae bacterium]|jgi:phospholipid/cholesterol/gamma-HCH transport system substrate-binding protein|nr:MlaD family protein [Solirubrobacteraceae bacterium]